MDLKTVTPLAALHSDDVSPGPRAGRCWCGNTNLLAFGAGYLRCAVCETLVVENMPKPEDLIDSEHRGGFYGPSYYDDYQKSLGLPSLTERARTDLSERCCYWLRTILKYKQPPGSVLEVGCAHGGFVAMLKAAGFVAQGLEVSSSLAEFAQRTFQVRVLVGPIEQQQLEGSSLDAIPMMDVLEHLPDPEVTLRHCRQALRGNGLVLIQTPRYREGKSLQEMEDEDDPFLKLLTPEQHLYLFSLRSVQLLLVRCGFHYIQVEPAFFSAYDMFLAASAEPLHGQDKGKIESLLADTVEARWIAALLDAVCRFEDVQDRLVQSDADRAARLREIERQGRQLIEIDEERKSQVEILQEAQRRADELERARSELQARIVEQDADRAKLLVEERRKNAVLERKTAELNTRFLEQEADCTNRLMEIERQGRQLREQEADLANRLREIERQGRQIREQEADLANRLREIERQGRQISELEADRANRLMEIERQGNQIIEIDADRNRRLFALEELVARNAELDKRAAELQGAARGNELASRKMAAALDVTGKALSALQQQLAAEQQAIRDRDLEIERQREQTGSLSTELSSVRDAHRRVIDQLTEQKRLVDALASVQSELALSARRKRLLASIEESSLYRVAQTFGLWKSLDFSILRPAVRVPVSAPKLSMIAVNLTPVLPGGANGGAKLLAVELVRNLALLAPECEFLLLTSKGAHEELALLDSFNVQRLCVDIPGAPVSKANEPGSTTRAARKLPARRADQPVSDFLVQVQCDLMFCPFTAPSHSDRRIPVVSVVLDVQFLDYPQFFEPSEIAERDRNFRAACDMASKVICISDFVRGTVVANSTRKPSDVVTIHISLEDRITQADSAVVDRVLYRYQIEPHSFLLYPANFWKHKNHEILLTAFGMYRARNPSSTLRLVLTGSPGARMDYLEHAAEVMGFSGYIIFAGFLLDQEVTALMRSSMALIFPSLYEGFGIPVVEAMSLGAPVLCGNLTSLPEVAGDAALFFDPRMPAEIVTSIETLEKNPDLRREMVAKGLTRAERFGSGRGMAASYLKVFREAASGYAMMSRVQGVYHDDWASPKVEVVVGPGGSLGRTLHISAIVPQFFPDDPIHLEVLKVTEGSSDFVTLSKEQPTELVLLLDPAGARFEIVAERTYSPSELGVGADGRRMAFKMISATVRDEKGGVTTLSW